MHVEARSEKATRRACRQVSHPERFPISVFTFTIHVSISNSREVKRLRGAGARGRKVFISC